MYQLAWGIGEAKTRRTIEKEMKKPPVKRRKKAKFGFNKRETSGGINEGRIHWDDAPWGCCQILKEEGQHPRHKT